MQKKTKTTKTAPKPTKPTAEKPDSKLGELQTTRERKTVLMQGNEAVAYGALDAGCDFFAGYPITPSTEIAEILALELPKRGGVFVQMEDEIASICAITGASLAGAKSLTATSGPGFSLMQEGIGFARITETPCVVVNVQRVGPSTGMPTSLSMGRSFSLSPIASTCAGSMSRSARRWRTPSPLSTPAAVASTSSGWVRLIVTPAPKWLCICAGMCGSSATSLIIMYFTGA